MPAIVMPRIEGLAEENPTVYESFRDLIDQLNQTQPSILVGEGAPESVVPAAPGTAYIQTDADTGALAIHVKDQDFGNTGWAQLGSFGSIPPSAGGGFQAIATTNGVTFYYDGTNGSQVITIYTADGGTAQVPAGKTVVTGLQPNTTYFFYPYYDERSGTLQFVQGSAYGNATGNPGAAYTADSSLAAQQMRLTSRIPLTGGSSVSVTTTSSGSSGPNPVGGGVGGKGRFV